jgi:tryptophan-rich sensory protein
MTFQSYINIVALSFTIIVNFVCAWGPFGIRTIKQVSDERKTKFTPPKWTFMIWTVIYITQILFMIYQFIYHPLPSLSEAIWIHYLVLCGANVAW